MNTKAIVLFDICTKYNIEQQIIGRVIRFNSHKYSKTKDIHIYKFITIFDKKLLIKALKLIQDPSQSFEELLKDHKAESIVDNTTSEEEVSFAHEVISGNESEMKKEDSNNDLSEFGVDSNSPDLFNSGTETSDSEDLLSSKNDEDEDDLEIPAFLRRQKN